MFDMPMPNKCHPAISSVVIDVALMMASTGKATSIRTFTLLYFYAKNNSINAVAKAGLGFLPQFMLLKK